MQNLCIIQKSLLNLVTTRGYIHNFYNKKGQTTIKGDKLQRTTSTIMKHFKGVASVGCGWIETRPQRLSGTV